MNILEILQQPFFEAVGWALLHFLWQGAAIAFLLIVISRWWRFESANARYTAACAALFLMAIAPLATLQHLLNQQPFDTGISAEIRAPRLSFEAIPPTMEPTTVKATWAASSRDEPWFSNAVDSIIPWVVLGWLSVVAFLSLRLLAGWFQVRRIRVRSTESLGVVWDEKLRRLARELSLSRSVAMFKSAWVEVPTVVGWFRPVILFPATSLTGLTPEQLETILAHELAHIQRHDYVVNLLQSLVETLLFYHPAVWWVSRMVRQEREHCCDDLAVRICGDRIAYARALTALEEMRGPQLRWGVAANDGSLLARIRRVLGKAPEPNRSSWWIAGITVIALVAAAAVIAQSPVAVAAESTKGRLLFARVEPSPGTPPGEALIPVAPELSESVELAEIKNADDGQLEIHVQFNERGREILEKLTQANVGNRLAIVFDGRALVKPILREPITGGRILISGRFTQSEAEEITAALNSGKPKPSQNAEPEIRAAPDGPSVRAAQEVLERTERNQTNHVVRAGNTSLAKSNLVHMSKGRQKIQQKLATIVLEEVLYESIPLSEVVKHLSREARQRDPDKQGINFIINSQVDIPPPLLTSGDVDPVTGAPWSAPPPTEPVDLNNFLIRLNPPMRNVTLWQVIEAVTHVADKPLKFSVEDYAVVFTQRAPEAPQLFTRTFRIDPSTVFPNIEDAVPRFLGVNKQVTSESVKTMNRTELLRHFFGCAGVDFPALAPEAVSQKRKALFYNDRSGVILARATLEELDLMEQALRVVNTPPPQVEVEVKFTELTEAKAKELGFHWFLGATNGKPQGSGTKTLSRLQRDSQFTNMAASVTTITGTASGILTEAQYKDVIKALEQHSGVDLLSAPRMTTLSGRQARIDVTKNEKIVLPDKSGSLPRNRSETAAEPKSSNRFESRDVPVGPSVDVLAKVSADKKSVQLNVSAEMLEFLGYDDPGPFLPIVAGEPPQPQPSPGPRPAFRLRQASGDVVLWNGQTLVLGGMPGDSHPKTKERKYLIIFVTPAVIDPDAKRVNP